MQASAVVERHVRLKTSAKVAEARKRQPLQRICLERVEERLHVRVVLGRATTSHALTHSEIPESMSEQCTLVLASPIAVEDQTASWLAPPHRPVEGPAGELGAAHLPQPPAQHAS